MCSSTRQNVLLIGLKSGVDAQGINLESYFYSKIWPRGVSRGAKHSIHLLPSRAVSLSHPSFVPHIGRLPIAPPRPLLPKLCWRKQAPIAASERRTSPQTESRNAKHVVNPGGMGINPRFYSPASCQGPLLLSTLRLVCAVPGSTTAMMMLLLRASVLLLPLLGTASGFVALAPVGGLQQRRNSASAAVCVSFLLPHY